MSAAIIEGKLIKKCEDCGEPAYYGFNCFLRSAHNAAKSGNMKKAKKSPHQFKKAQAGVSR